MRYLKNLSNQAIMERDKFLEKSKDNCSFCDMKGNGTRGEDAVICSPNFTAIVDIAPPTDFYFVVYPNQHMLSYYEVPEEHGKEFDDIIKLLKEKTGRENIVLFENGAGNRGNGDYGVVSHQSVFHAHSNVVLLEQDKYVIPEIRKRFLSLGCEPIDIEPDGFNHIRDVQIMTDGKPFFSIRQGRSGLLVIEEGEKKVPSQFVRRTIAEVYNNGQDSPFWNWKDIDPVYRNEIELRKENMRVLFR